MVSTNDQQRSSPHRGIVLFVVTIVLALVSLAALGFLVSMKTENRAAHLQADQMQVDQVAASAEAYLKAWSQLSRDEQRFWGGLEMNPSQFQGIIVDWQPWGSRHGRFSILAPHYEDIDTRPVFQFGASLTSGKLNLHRLLAWDQQKPGHARSALMNLPGMTESVADAMLDWIDADDEKREFGAESEYYMALDPPRQPLNQVPARLAHLLAARGVRRSQLLGTFRPPYQVLNPDGLATADSAMMTTDVDPLPRSTGPAANAQVTDDITAAGPPWSHFLTVHSAERDQAADGSARIDLNQENLNDLHRQLTEAFQSELADFVVAARQFGLQQVNDQATDQPLPPLNRSNKPKHKFASPLDLLDVATAIPTSSDDDKKPKLYASPFQTKRRESLNKLIDWMDRTTTRSSPDDKPTTATRIEGRVNLMLAPRSVLLSVPGITEELAEEIITQRDIDSTEPGARKHAVWLLVEERVDVSTMKQLLPNVTVGGNIIMAQIVAYYDARSPWSRHQVTIDGTREPAATVDFQDLGRRGRGFRMAQLASVDRVETPTTTGSTSSPADRTMQPPTTSNR